MTAAVPPQLIDRFGRTVDYLRISITDRCDFRCVYCMAEDMVFLPRAQILSLEEIYTLAQTFTGLGVKKIRITGGEPLVRKGALELLQKIGALPGLEELVLTTNGSQLAAMASALKAAGVKRVNISLDTLDATKFKAITRTGDLQQVINGIQAATAVGFERVKLNAVILKGRNHEEVGALVSFCHCPRRGHQFHRRNAFRCGGPARPLGRLLCQRPDQGGFGENLYARTQCRKDGRAVQLF